MWVVKMTWSRTFIQCMQVYKDFTSTPHSLVFIRVIFNMASNMTKVYYSFLSEQCFVSGSHYCDYFLSALGPRGCLFRPKKTGWIISWWAAFSETAISQNWAFVSTFIHLSIQKRSLCQGMNINWDLDLCYVKSDHDILITH